MTDEHIELMLEEMAMKDWKVVVLHCQPQLMLRIVEHSVTNNLFGTGYGWFLSETAMTYDKEDLKRLPEGLMGIRGFYRNKTRGLLKAAARTISCAYECMQECFSDISLPVPLDDSLSSSSSLSYSGLNVSSHSPSSSLLFKRSLSSFQDLSSPPPSLSLPSEDAASVPLKDRFRVTCNDTTQYFTQ